MKSKIEIGEYDHKNLIIFRISETGVLILKLWDVTVSSSSYCFRFLLLRECSYSHWNIIFSWFIFLPHSLSCRAHPPTDWFIAGCLEAGVRVMLRRVHSDSIQLLYFGTFVFVNDICGSWEAWLILYIHMWRTLW